MKMLFRTVLLLAVAAAATEPLHAAPRGARARKPAVMGMTSRVALGARFHPPHTMIEKWPYDDDFSYGISYALYEGIGYLELGLDYAPEAMAESVIDDVITPRLNMAIKDSYFVAGIGIADAYVRRVVGDAEWTGLLYQFHLGLEIPLGQSFEIGGGAYYSFDDFDDLADFDAADLEYGVRLGYLF